MEIQKLMPAGKTLINSGESMLTLRNGSILLINEIKEEIKLINKEDKVQLVISIKDDGLILNVSALELNVHAAEDINLSARKISLAATEEISIRSDGNLVQQVGNNSTMDVNGTNSATAKTQKLTASLGNVEIKANDDVKIDGERALINCD